MKNILFVFAFATIQFGIMSNCNGQDDFFVLGGVGLDLYDSDHYNLNTTFEYQYLLQHNEWRSWDLTVSGIRHLGRFDIKAAGYFSRTIDTEFKDVVEIRPWAALYYHFPLQDNIQVTQYVRSEWRNIYSQEDDQVDRRARIRYAIELKVPLTNMNKHHWTFKPRWELFILRKQDIEERFINKSTFRLAFVRKCFKTSSTTVAYKMTSLNDKFNTKASRGHEFSVSFSF